jgi:xanthine dehydrogenase accessory factor
MRNIYAELLHGLEEKSSLALATLIDTKGSTPQIPGISALFGPAGIQHGTLGGGLLEADAERRIRSALEHGISISYEFDLDSDISEPIGAICGGKAGILVDVHPAKHLEVFRAMQLSIDNGQSGALLTCIGDKGDGTVILAREWIAENNSSGWDTFEQYRDAIIQAINERKPAMLTLQEGFFEETDHQSQLFVDPVYPLMRLIICGAGHIGRALAHLAHRLEFEVTVIDDRADLANKDNIPEADHIIVAEISEGMERVSIKPDTFVVIVNRAHRWDIDSLRASINSDAAYIGMIGSSRKVKLVKEKAVNEGWATEKQLDSIHAPVGLAIEAQSVEEIAISIAAELVAVRSGHLRGTKP